eukprot:g58880.t1
MESKLALLSSFVSDTRVSGHSEVAQLRASSSALPTKRNILYSFLVATKGTNQVTPEQQRREAREPTSAVKVLKSDSNDALFLLTFSGRSDTATSPDEILSSFLSAEEGIDATHITLPESSCKELVPTGSPVKVQYSLAISKLNPNQPPSLNKVNKVWRDHYPDVHNVRDGDFAKDDICTALALECKQLHKEKERVCKKWGDAQEHWHGINDVPISNPTGGPIHAFVRRPARSFPRKLPPIEWATPRLRKEVMQVAEMLCGDVEKERIKDQIAHPDSLRGIHFDGEYGSGPYPGRPGHLECIDRNGTVSRVNVFVLGDVPPDPWAVPADREAKIRAVTHLTEEERKDLSRVVFVNDTEPPRVGNVGARVLTAAERLRQDIALEQDMHPWRKVASLLLTAEDAAEFAKLRIVKKELVAWAREHGVDHRVDVKDGKRKDMSKPDLVKAVWSHAQTCECQ